MGAFSGASRKKVTVDQVSAAAGVHRSTFYFHYKDVYEILEEIEAELLQDLQTITVPDTFEGNQLDELARQFYVLYKQKAEYLHILVAQRRRPEFAEEYRNAIKKKMLSSLKMDSSLKTFRQNMAIEICVSHMTESLIACADNPKTNYGDMIEILKGFGTKGYYRTLVEDFSVDDMFNPFIKKTVFY